MSIICYTTSLVHCHCQPTFSSLKTLFCIPEKYFFFHNYYCKYYSLESQILNQYSLANHIHSYLLLFYLFEKCAKYNMLGEIREIRI